MAIAEMWLLLAHLTLKTGESVDILISIHPSESDCLVAIPAPRIRQRGRRYDCRPLVADPWEPAK